MYTQIFQKFLPRIFIVCNFALRISDILIKWFPFQKFNNKLFLHFPETFPINFHTICPSVLKVPEFLVKWKLPIVTINFIKYCILQITTCEQLP